MGASQVIFAELAARGVTDVFTVPGGHIMYLTDALARSSVKLRHLQHEQACAIAAEAYARIQGLGACLVTTGPGSTNALSAIAGAYVESVPVVVISGQVRTVHIADYARQRQKGPQEIDIVSMAKPVTKYATTLSEHDDVAEVMRYALHVATEGRPGPVWLNVPIDLQ